jgi:hypothetical protein
MRTYTFYFSDPATRGRDFDFDIAECEDEPEARRWARVLLLREPERRMVEVWAGAEAVFQLDRFAE